MAVLLGPSALILGRRHQRFECGALYVISVEQGVVAGWKETVRVSANKSTHCLLG